MKLNKFIAAAVLPCVCAGAVAEIEMRPRPIGEKDFPEYIQYLVDVAEPRTPEERALDKGSGVYCVSNQCGRRKASFLRTLRSTIYST